MSKENGLKQYIGDSIYADLENGMIKLTTENGLPDDPSNTIYLESFVLRNLQQYEKWLVQKLNIMAETKEAVKDMGL